MSRPSQHPRMRSGGWAGWNRVAAKEPPESQRAGETMDQWVRERLTKAVGPARCEAILSDTLRQINRGSLDTPKDLLEFAEHLIRQGGLLMAVGTAFKIYAVLRGANEVA